MKLPQIINQYVEASNKHDVKPIVACFSADAIVHDEGEQLRGKKAIEDWASKTIQKYKFHFKPLAVRGDNAEVVVTIELSGTFHGSPVTLGFHFTIENDKISSLTID